MTDEKELLKLEIEYLQGMLNQHGISYVKEQPKDRDLVDVLSKLKIEMTTGKHCLNGMPNTVVAVFLKYEDKVISESRVSI